MMQKGYCLLGQRALFRLEGADRLRYLNGQVSNAVSKATDSSAIQACILTAKGKLCAVVWIWTAPDAILIESDPDLHDSLQARLERYIIADDVTLIDESDRFHLVHVIDPDFTEGIAVLRFGVPGRDLLVPVEERDTIIKRLEAQGLQVLPVDDLEYHRINNGMPTWGRELDENTLPQEARLEDQAVDFHKGCYVGQEVVSRIKSVGRVNRRLFGLESDNLLSSGMVLAPENSPETPVGSITSVSPVFGLSKWIGMGYVKHGFDLPGGRLLASNPENGLQTSVRMREFPIDTAL